MPKDDVIEGFSDPWCPAVVLNTEKHGTTRFCVDYRKLNNVTNKDGYPLSRIDDTLTTSAGHR